MVYLDYGILFIQPLYNTIKMGSIIYATIVYLHLYSLTKCLNGHSCLKEIIIFNIKTVTCHNSLPATFEEAHYSTCRYSSRLKELMRIISIFLVSKTQAKTL